MTLLAGLSSSGSQETYLGWRRHKECGLSWTWVGDVIAYRPSTKYSLRLGLEQPGPTTQSNEPRSGNPSRSLRETIQSRLL